MSAARTLLFLASLAHLGCPKDATVTDPKATSSTDPSPPKAADPRPAATEPAVAPISGRYVLLTTSMGKIKIELFRDKAPLTTQNFLRYVQAKHYDGTIFHRVIATFMIQGGGFDTSLREKPTQTPIRNEAKNGLRNERGTVAMARTMNPHSASAQFFINVKDNDFLNHRDESLRGWGYTVFGKVVEGLEVVDKIKQVPTGPKPPLESDVPQTDVVIQSARVVDA